MAFDIKEDCEVVVEALCNGFLQGRDLFIRELISVRGDKEMAHSSTEKEQSLLVTGPKIIYKHRYSHFNS